MGYLDLDQWPRRAQYEFFRGYELPFFNVCAPIDATPLRTICKARGQRFNLALWFACQQVVNEVEAFRLRLRKNGVWRHERVSVATTALDPKTEVFRFCYLPFADDFPAFARGAEAAMQGDASGLGDQPEEDAVIHGTVLPWVKFTSVQHPRRLATLDSVPKIAFGRCELVDNRAELPVSVEAHHALMDGLHAGRFFEVLTGWIERAEDWV